MSKDQKMSAAELEELNRQIALRVSNDVEGRPSLGKGSGRGSKLKLLRDIKRSKKGSDAMKFLLAVCKANYQAKNPDEVCDWGDSLAGLLVEYLVAKGTEPFCIKIVNLQVLLDDLKWSLAQLKNILSGFGFVIRVGSSSYFSHSLSKGTKELLSNGSFTLIVSHNLITTGDDVNLSVGEKMRGPDESICRCGLQTGIPQITYCN